MATNTNSLTLKLQIKTFKLLIGHHSPLLHGTRKKLL